MLPLSLPVLPSPARAGCEHCWPCEELPGVPSPALASSPSQGHAPRAAASHGLRARCCCAQWSPCLYPRLGDVSHPLPPGCDPFGAQRFSPPAFPDPTTPGHVPPASVRSHIPRTGPWGFIVCCRILQAAGPWPGWDGEGPSSFSRETSPDSLSAGPGAREQPHAPGELTPALTF